MTNHRTIVDGPALFDMFLSFYLSTYKTKHPVSFTLEDPNGVQVDVLIVIKEMERLEDGNPNLIRFKGSTVISPNFNITGKLEGIQYSTQTRKGIVQQP